MAKIRIAKDGELEDVAEGIRCAEIFTSDLLAREDEKLTILYLHIVWPSLIYHHAVHGALALNGIGILYGWLSQAAPHRIDGYPVFFRTMALSERQWKIVRLINKDFHHQPQRPCDPPLQALINRELN